MHSERSSPSARAAALARTSHVHLRLRPRSAPTNPGFSLPEHTRRPRPSPFHGWHGMDPLKSLPRDLERWGCCGLFGPVFNKQALSPSPVRCCASAWQVVSFKAPPFSCASALCLPLLLPAHVSVRGQERRYLPRYDAVCGREYQEPGRSSLRRRRLPRCLPLPLSLCTSRRRSCVEEPGR